MTDMEQSETFAYLTEISVMVTLPYLAVRVTFPHL